MGLETGIFDGRPADYFFMLLFNWLLAVIVALFMSIPFIMDPMVMSILYVWCQLNKDTIVNFWFGTQFKAMYLPWVLFGFNMIIAGGGVMELVGILIGHMYFFLSLVVVVVDREVDNKAEVEHSRDPTSGAKDNA